MSRSEELQALEGADLGFEVIRHAHTDTAREEAAVLGVSPAHLAKTVVLHTQTGYVRALVPASRQLDVQKVRRLLHDKHVRLATEAELTAAYPMFELGAVSPLGGPSGDTVLLDTRLTEHDQILVEAGTHDESIRMRTATLMTLANPVVEDICRR